MTQIEPRAERLAQTGLSYLEAGSGPPVLLLHGWAAFKEIWWGTLRSISDVYHGVALEWPGHGTTPDRGETVLEHLAALAADACAELGLERVAVVGHSMGGNVAALLALEYPALVERLVLVDAALDPRFIAPYGRRMLDAQVVARSVRSSRRVARALRWASSPDLHGGGIVRPYLRRAWYNGIADSQALHRYIGSLYDSTVAARLGDIGQPTLVVTGQFDPLVLPRQARAAAATIPNAQLAVIPRGLHNPMDDRPAVWYRTLRAFLDQR